MRIILASQSPRRAKVFKKLGLPFEIIPSNFDEKIIKEKNPLKLVEKLALEKARAVARKNTGALVVGGDNVIELNGKILGKPKDLAEARKILLEASGRTLKTYNGVALIYNEKERSTAVSGFGQMKKYSNEAISNYFARVNPLDKAGGFAGDPAEGGEFLENFEGEPGEELGLPLNSLKKLLKSFEVKV